MLSVQDFCQHQVRAHVAAVGAGVAVDRTAHRAGDGGGPFQAAQTAQGHLAGHGAEIGPGFGPHRGRGAAHVDFHRFRAVDQHQPAKTAVADQHVRTAAQDHEGRVHLPQPAHGIFQFGGIVHDQHGVSRAADMGGGVVGQLHVLLQPVGKCHAEGIEWDAAEQPS